MVSSWFAGKVGVLSAPAFLVYMKGVFMDECLCCGFWDSDRGCCTCPSHDMWYACPIESEKPENIRMMKEYVKWLSKEDKNE